ncbi:MAG TPA: hypothetical protein VFS43_27720 [Polyangiaceae bacterium]|nr:hypothetical protein [Polyangiaceae bacterium]
MPKAIVLSGAREGLEGGDRHVLSFTSDYRLRGVCQRFGMAVPQALAFPNSQPLVGSYDPNRHDHLARVRAAAPQLGAA